MELLKYGLDVLLHLDTYLGAIIREYGFWTHLLLFIVIFCETGLVVTPFLPGDSLLFVAGTFAALGALDLTWLLASLPIAAICGDSSNYWIGRLAGPRFLARFINRKYLDRTHQFYERHGGKTVIIARFVPIIRTFAPFVAGVGSMVYARFLAYSVAGNIGWIMIFTLGGYFFGNIPVVKRNFTLVILAVIFVSLLPGIIESLRQHAALSRTSRHH